MKHPYTDKDKTECLKRARAFRYWVKRRGFTYNRVANLLGVQAGLVESWAYKGPKVLEMHKQKIAKLFVDCPLIAE